MMGFEEQWDNDGFLSNCGMQDAKHFYKAGAASRQAEIDELKKRIDEALKVFKSDLSTIGKFDTIYNILKGGSSE